VTVSVQQLSVFLENKSGRIAEVLHLLGEREVEVFGFMAPDCSDYGIARLVVDRAEAAGRFLRDGGFTAIQNPVLCVELGQGAGALPNLVGLLGEAGVNIEYLYLTTTRAAVLKVEDIESVEQMLRGAGLRVLAEGQDSVA
jgi:hypothetical protein